MDFDDGEFRSFPKLKKDKFNDERVKTVTSHDQVTI